jgi:hypothetical protein
LLGKEASMLNPELMAPNERAFIRTYVMALRRDYGLLNCVTALMQPDGLAVGELLTAVKVSMGLQQLHDEFDGRVLTVAAKRDISVKPAPPFGPSLDEMAHWFELSFFKVMLALQKNSVLQQQNEGWCSGQPSEWKAFFKDLAEECLLDDDLDLPDSKILGAFSKFLPPWQKPPMQTWHDWWPLLKHKKFPPLPPQYEPEDWDEYEDDEDDDTW